MDKGKIYSEKNLDLKKLSKGEILEWSLEKYIWQSL